MAALLTATGRPGFYLRVIEEGAVAAGDAITYVVKGPERITVAVANSLLYSKSHPRDLLERSLRIPALSPGWRGSFEALLKSNDANPDGVGNAGLMPAPSGHSPRPGFRALEVVRKQSESVDVVSFVLEPKDGQPLMLPAPVSVHRPLHARERRWPGALSQLFAVRLAVRAAVPDQRQWSSRMGS
jgi:hypothetical protein